MTEENKSVGEYVGGGGRGGGVSNARSNSKPSDLKPGELKSMKGDSKPACPRCGRPISFVEEQRKGDRVYYVAHHYLGYEGGGRERSAATWGLRSTCSSRGSTTWGWPA
jgi:hypothetical protein